MLPRSPHTSPPPRPSPPPAALRNVPFERQVDGRWHHASHTGIALAFFLSTRSAPYPTPPLLPALPLLALLHTHPSSASPPFPPTHPRPPICAARNVPVDRQSTAVGVVTAASYAGTALAFGVSPFLISQMGWQAVFYLFGALALLWLPLWFPVKVGLGGEVQGSGLCVGCGVCLVH